MLKTKIIDKLKSLVNSSPEKYDEGDLRLQKIHVLLDDAERNFGAANAENPAKDKSGKEEGFVRGKYADNLKLLENEILNIKGLLSSGKTQDPNTQKISCEVDSLAKELSVVKKTLVDYSETIESILREIAAEKMPGKDAIMRHDRDISSIKAELLKSVRITDAVASGRDELDKRIKKIEDAQSSKEDSGALVRKAVDDAVRGIPLQKDRASIKNSISELKKGLLMLKAEMETDLAKYPQNLAKLKQEMSKVKGMINSKDSQSKDAGKISKDVNAMAKELSMVKTTLVGHSETIESILNDLAANNKASKQAGIVLKSIVNDLNSAKNENSIEREKDRAAIEAELSQIRGEICGIKDVFESMKAAEMAKKRKARKRKSGKDRAQDTKNPAKKIYGNKSMFRALLEYNGRQRMNAPKRNVFGQNRGKTDADSQIAVRASAQQSKNNDYVELEPDKSKYKRHRISRRKRNKPAPKNKNRKKI